MKPHAEFNTKSGNRLEIYFDEHAESPRSCDNLGTLIMCDKEYKHLGDKARHEFTMPCDWDELENYIKDVLKAVIYFPVQILHQGFGKMLFITPAFCNFTVGFIYVTKEALIKEYGECTPLVTTLASKILISEIQEMDHYVSRRCYGFKLIKVSPLDDPIFDEEIDSCWGFLGNDLKKNGILDSLGEEDSLIHVSDLDLIVS